MEIFEVLKHLRDINTLRELAWHIEEHGDNDPHVLVVRIPISDEDSQFMHGMQQLFAPVEECSACEAAGRAYNPDRHDSQNCWAHLPEED